MLFHQCMFYINKEINNRTFWICSNYYKTKCKARCVTNMESKLEKWTGLHNHPPSNNRIEIIKEQQIALNS